MKLRLLIILLTTLTALATSCSDRRYHHELLLAEEQVTRNADSCQRLLDAIPVDELRGEDLALHGLLSSWLKYRLYAKEIPAEPLETAFAYYHDSKDPHRRAQVYFLHSVIGHDQRRGLPTQWMKDLYTACLAIEQTDDYLLASQIYQNYAIQLKALDQFDEAMTWFDKFMDAAEKSGNKREYVQSQIVTSSNIQLLEEERLKQELATADGKEIAKHTTYVKAFELIYAALATAKEYDMEVEKGRIYTQLSLYHSRCQQTDSTLYYARLACSINERLYAQGKRKELPHYLNLSDAHRKLGNADSAIYYALKTYETPEMPLGNKRVAAQLLYNVYSDLKTDYETSLNWLRVYNQLTDSIKKGTIATNIEAVQEAAVSEQERSELLAEQQHTMHWLVGSSAIALLIIGYISYRLLRNRRRYRQRLHEQEEDFNRKLAEMRSAAESEREQPSTDTVAQPDEGAPAEATIAAPTQVTLNGSTREQLVVEAARILCMCSESNYVKVYLLDDEGRVQSKMIRQTMNNIESQLSDYPYIIRCHRAFIVNLRHVQHATSVPAGLQLTLEGTSLTVPVSKTYIGVVREAMVS